TDPDFAAGSLVGRRPTVTTVTSISPPTLPTNTYYWRVTPLDAEGNTPLSSSTSPSDPKDWHFESGIGVGSGLNTPENCIQKPENLVDFPGIRAAFPNNALDTIFCPTLSWQPVLGASRYEVEINSDEQWAAGSR